MTGCAAARAADARRTAVVSAAIVMLVLIGGCNKRDASERWGRDLVFATSIPAGAIARFNEFEPKPPDPRASAIDNLLAETEDWRSATEIYASATTNPYRIAIHVTGEVTAPEGAVTLWHAGFVKSSKDGDGDGAVTRPVPGLNAPAPSAAGTHRFDRTMASPPVSFRDDAKIYPVIQLQRRSGLRIESVDVEVWSGLAEPTWKEMLFSGQGALVGLVMLVLGWFWFRPRD